MHPLKGLILIFKEWYHQLPLKGTALWLRCQLPSLHSCPLKQIVFLALKWEFTLSLGQSPLPHPGLFLGIQVGLSLRGHGHSLFDQWIQN